VYIGPADRHDHSENAACGDREQTPSVSVVEPLVGRPAARGGRRENTHWVPGTQSTRTSLRFPGKTFFRPETRGWKALFRSSGDRDWAWQRPQTFDFL